VRGKHAGRTAKSLIASLSFVLLAGCASSLKIVSEPGYQTTLIMRQARTHPGLVDRPDFRRAVAAEAMLDRRDFVPRDVRSLAYVNTPLPIGWRQTISNPYIVAVMTAAAGIGPGSRVLEIGTGSGYQAAVLARLGARVSTIEIVPELARRAEATLRRLGIRTVAVRAGDGFFGWSDHAPFDAIIVTAGVGDVPAPLLDQLAPGGRIVIPVGPTQDEEQLLVVTRWPSGELSRCSLGPAAFVPFTGAATSQKAGAPTAPIPWCYGEAVT
jgi:protein-L-isoaspartate(D-aspartate) O-methyltransferase